MGVPRATLCSLGSQDGEGLESFGFLGEVWRMGVRAGHTETGSLLHTETSPCSRLAYSNLQRDRGCSVSLDIEGTFPRFQNCGQHLHRYLLCCSSSSEQIRDKNMEALLSVVPFPPSLLVLPSHCPPFINTFLAIYFGWPQTTSVAQAGLKLIL